MKQTFLAILLMLLPMMASAETVEIGGIWYNLIPIAKKAEVTSNPNKYSGDVNIPSSVTNNGQPYSVTSIGHVAFAECSGLVSVTIPNSVISIGDWAFYECSGLTSITIPSSLTSIGIDAFSGCSGLTSIVVESGNQKYDSRNSCNAIIETSSNTLILGCMNTIIPNSVTTIRSGVFNGCSGLTTINIPNSVTSIDGNPFFGCSELTSIIVDSDNPQYDSRNNCNAIIETSSNSLIVGCKNTTIPNSVISISIDAFRGCSELTSITIPNSVTLIGQRAFLNCYSLTDISIPNSVSSIENMAFQFCSSLTSITIPNSVTRIEDGAFLYCWNLRDIYCWSENVPNIGESTFESSLYIAATLHVPAVSIDTYKQTYPWSKYVNIVPLTDDDPKPTGMLSLKTNDNIYPVDIYSIDGKCKSQPQRGLNIIRMSDGSTKKVMIK